MRDWDVAHYGRIFNAACKNADMTTIQYPDGKAIDKHAWAKWLSNQAASHLP